MNRCQSCLVSLPDHLGGARIIQRVPVAASLFSALILVILKLVKTTKIKLEKPLPNCAFGVSLCPAWRGANYTDRSRFRKPFVKSFLLYFHRSKNADL